EDGPELCLDVVEIILSRLENGHDLVGLMKTILSEGGSLFTVLTSGQSPLLGERVNDTMREAASSAMEGETRPAAYLRNAWTAGNLQYKVLIEEVSADAWPAGRIYRADVFGDGQLISRLYFKNANAGSTVEGVKMKVDLGSPTLLYGSFTTVITRLNACP
ncbi:MAG: hypothetical protein IIB15_06035, partial [Chloroflexi bacterium]|nr:hypothetical protein [Chloroflexota bacterium]